MAKKLNSVLGIDIGSRSIKIAELKGQGNQPVISAMGMIDTPEGAVDHTGVFNADAVAAALKQVCASSGVSVPNVVVSIAGQASVLVRTLEVPRMSANELSEHMQWEISRNIPFAESTVLSDFKQLEDEDPSSQNMDVVMAISPQSAVDTLLACVKKAGKQVMAIDVEPLCFARSLHVTQSLGDKDVVCIVDIGHKTTAINIYRGKMFTTAIADAMMMSAKEAEDLKISRATIPDSVGSSTPNPFSVSTPETQAFTPYNPFADPGATVSMDPQAPIAPEPEPDLGKTVSTSAAPVPAQVTDPETLRIYNAMAPVLDEFCAEVRRSLDYFRSKGGDVSKLMLCGGGARLGGLTEFLNRSLNLPCELYDPTKNIGLNAKKVSPEFVTEHAQEFAVAVGNGLHIFF
jgi:type IV pilus assembly protein PilM